MNTLLIAQRHNTLKGIGAVLPGSKYATVKLEVKNEESSDKILVEFDTSAPLTYPGSKYSKDINISAEHELETELDNVEFFCGLDSAKRNEEINHIRKMDIPLFTGEIASLDPLSTAGHIYMLFNTFCLLVDDILDVNVFMDKKQNFEFKESELLNFVNDCTDILQGNTFIVSKASTKVFHTSGWQLTRLRILLSRVICLVKQFCPKYTDTNISGYFIDATQNLLLNHVWMVKYYPADDFLLKSTLLSLRAKRVGFDCQKEFILILKNLSLSRCIRNDPIFERICETKRNYSFCLNDLMGFARDVKNNDYDSMIYLSYRNGLDLKTCLAEYAQLLMNEHNEYLLLSTRFKQMHYTDKSVLRYFEYVDQCLSGQISYYINVSRYEK